MPTIIDLTGQRFEKLTAIRMVGKNKNHKALWECQCECGNVVIVDSNSLRRGNSKSCGCSRRHINTKHGDSGRTRLYRIWANMTERTTNPNNQHWDDYGGRGITICDEWKDYSNFKTWALENGYSPDLTIDRIDNSKGYSPHNCRWVTRKAQCYNRRSNHLLTYHGESKTIQEWADQSHLKRNALVQRLHRGWSVEKALETPVKS